MTRNVVKQGRSLAPATTQTTKIAWMGLAGVFVFACAVILMHAIQPELSPIDDAVSYYMNGRLGWILSVGLIFLGVGSLAVLWVLRKRINTNEARFGSWCLGVWGAGVIIGGIFPPDPRGHWGEPPSLAGMIHANVAMIAFLAFPIAALLLSGKIGQRQSPESPRLTPLLRGFAFASGLLLLVFFVCLAPVFSRHAPYALGLAERVLLLAYVAWLGTASILAATNTKKETSGPEQNVPDR
jgi:hypothetical membrane protein